MRLTRIDAVVVALKHLPVEATQKTLKNEFNIDVSKGHIMNRRTDLKELATKILYEEAKHFPDQHLTHLSTIKYLIKGSFEDLEEEEEPIKRQHIRDSIASLQYDLASFNEATQGIIEGRITITTSPKDNNEQKDKTSIQLSKEPEIIQQ